MVSATTVERGHRRKAGVDVCRGVGWIALQGGGERGGHIQSHHTLFPGASFRTHNIARETLSGLQNGQASILLYLIAFIF